MFYSRAALESTYLGIVHPKWDGPRLRSRHERSEQRAHVRRQYNKGRPDVDLAGTLVKEEQVKDEHQATALTYGAEEAIEYSCRHERRKGCRGSAPRCCSGSND